MTQDKDKNKIRESVSQAYSKAVKAGCCGTAPKGIAANMAGYGDELASLPQDAVVNSFGCGNPLAMSEVREGETVLDLGSGAGIDLLLAARKVGASGRVIGVDMTDDMIARARANIEAAGVMNVEVRKGIIEKLPVEDASVDWVISNCVINLSPDKPAVFREIARVLKPGGRMVVSDIVAKDLPDFVKESAALYSSCIAGAIDEESYLAGLREAGLVAVEVRDRLVYDMGQIVALTASELDGSSCCGCGGGAADPETVDRIAKGLEGRIASVRVAARKPA